MPQNSLLIQCVRQNVPHLNLSAMQTTLTAKQGATEGICALRKGKEQSEMRTQTGTGSTAFYQPYRRRLLVPTGSSTKLVHGMITEMKGKHTGRMVNGWLGYETFFFFFSQDLAGDGNGTVLSVLFLTAPLTALLAAEPRSAMAR